MLKKKSDIYNLALIVCAFLITIALYNKLPDLVPIHWNAAGEIDGYGPKIFGGFMAPVIMILTWIGMKYLPNIDPKKNNYKKFEKSYSIIISLSMTFFLVLHVVTLSAAMGYKVSVDKIIPSICGILLIVIGNYLPKSKSNYFYGIKTPWTLSSDVSWRKTHRLGGKLSIISGIIIILSSFLLYGNAKVVIVMIAIFTAAIVPVIGSYFYAKNDRSKI